MRTSEVSRTPPADRTANCICGFSANFPAGESEGLSSADLFGAIYSDQWVVQLGAQYSVGRVRLRMGYAWAENPLRDNPGQSAGGVTPPGGRPVIEYIQSMLAVSNQHRLSGGVGVQNVLPGIDLDLFAGGMFGSSGSYAGGAVASSLESYWIGAGLTWRFGRGACEYGAWHEDGARSCSL